MSFFKNKNSGKGAREKIIKLDGTNLAKQATPPTDKTKVWIDTSK